MNIVIPLPVDVVDARPSRLSVVRRAVRSLWCRVNGGHWKVLHTEPMRLALRCVACGHTTPGWPVGERRFARTIAGDPARLRATRVM